MEKEPEKRSGHTPATPSGVLALGASGAWVLPFAGAALWLLPGSRWAEALVLILALLLAPLPALLHAHRQRARLRVCAEKAEENAAQLKLQLDTVRYRTARLREELQAADRQARLSHQLTLLGQFTAGFMHEFNNPLAIVAGRIEVLLEERKQDAALCADLERMLKETRYMGNIASTLLQALRRERGGEIFEASDPRKTLEETAATDATVMILGESGTGKEVTARFLHDHSRRKDGPYVPVECSAMPGSLIESELFGYERGAFTGAEHMKKGLIESADGGTLFLDEIGDLGVELQTRLFRFVEERALRRLGGVTTVKVDCRILCATNQDLTAKIKAGSFREELFYRLSVVTVKLPPLRERPEDVQHLARFFLERFFRRYGKSLSGSPQFYEALLRERWPGNVRQLKNVMERLTALHPGGVLRIPIRCYRAVLRGPHRSSHRGAGSASAVQELSRTHQSESAAQRHLRRTGSSGHERVGGIARRALQCLPH